MGRTPDFFPGQRLEESIRFLSGSVLPAEPGVMSYVTGSGAISGSGLYLYEEDIVVGPLRKLISSESHARLRQFIHFAGYDGPFEGFSGAVKDTDTGIFSSGSIWYTDSSREKKIIDKSITRSGILPTEITWNLYDSDGVTVTKVATDEVTYSGMFEQSRTRTIYDPLPWYEDLAPDAAYLVSSNEYTASNGVAQLGDDTGNNLIFQSSDSSSIPEYSSNNFNLGAIQFTAADNLQFATASALNGFKEEYAFAMYLHCSSSVSTQTIMSTYLQTGGSQNGLRLIFQGTTRTFWVIEQSAGTFIMNAQSATNSVDAPPNKYRIFVRTSRSGGTPHLKMYVNGVLIKTASYSASTYTGNPDQALKLAYAPATGNHFLNGSIRAMMFWQTNPVSSSGLSDDEFAEKVDNILLNAVSRRQLRVIVPFGDSITANASSYRKQLMTAVNTASDYKLQYNGYQTASGNFPLRDFRHEGVSGETIEQIEARVSAYPVSGDETDICLLAGTNSLSLSGSVASLVGLKSLISTTKSKFPGKRIWVFEIPYGHDDAVSDTYKETGLAGEFNAGLDSVIAASGILVRKIPIHAAGGATTYIWEPGTSSAPVDSQDSVGHPTIVGGEKKGNAAAQTMEII